MESKSLVKHSKEIKHLTFMFSYHDETMELMFHILLETLYNKINILKKNYNQKQDKRNKGITEGEHSSTYSIQFIIWTNNPGI